MHPVVRNILLSRFDPSMLFSSADQGAVYYGDFGPLYQDSAGASQVTALAQNVGRMLDRRFKLARGAEVVVNGDFAGGTTGWTPGSGTALSVIGGQLKALNAGGSDGAFFGQNLGAFSTGQTIEVYFDSIDDGTSKAARAYLGTVIGGGDISSVVTTAFGTQRRLIHTFAVDVAACWLWFYPGTLAVSNYILIDNVSVKTIPGNHCAQSVAGSRPTFDAGGKINFASGAKSLVTTWASSLGSSCTVGRSIPQGEASILTGQTIGTSFTETTDNCGLVIINRSLSSTETNQLRRWLNRRAG